MNNIRMNEFGLAETLESTLAQISALATTAHYIISNTDSSIYLQESAQLLVLIKNLAADGERYRAEWERMIPRQLPERTCRF